MSLEQVRSNSAGATQVGGLQGQLPENAQLRRRLKTLAKTPGCPMLRYVPGALVLRLTDDVVGTWKAFADAPIVSNEEYDTSTRDLERYVGAGCLKFIAADEETTDWRPGWRLGWLETRDMYLDGALEHTEQVAASDLDFDDFV